MRTFRAWLSRFAAIFNRNKRDRELADELESHLDLHTDDNLRRGLTAEEARREALVRLGGIEQTKEIYRDRRSLPMIETLLQDLRYGARMLRKNPGFTAVAVLTLALGIGANTAIFTFIDAIMLHAVPVHDPAHLFVFGWTAHAQPGYHGYSSHGGCFATKSDSAPSGCSFSTPAFEQFRSLTDVFSSVTAFTGPAQLEVSGNGTASLASGELVSGKYFQALGVTPALGRTLVPADDTPSSDPAVVLNYGYWQSAFGGATSAVGKSIRLDGVPFTIVGIAEPQFTGTSPGRIEDMWFPLSIAPRLKIDWERPSDSFVWWLQVAGRAKPGVSLTQAQAAASLVFRNELLHGAKPVSKPESDPAVALAPAQAGLVGMRKQFSMPLYISMAVVGIVLLIACANVAGLTLARSSARQKEIAVRLALGAGRARIVRQLLTESILLSAMGGALGIFFSHWGVHSLMVFISSSGLRQLGYEIRPDARVLLFTIAVSVLTGVFFGLAPALLATRVDLVPSLKDGRLSCASHAVRRRFSLGNALVVAQVSLSIVILVGAGLVVRTLANLRSVDPGFDTRNLLLFSIDPALNGYDDVRIQSLYRDLGERLNSLPGVISASYSSDTLVSGSLWTEGVKIEGRTDETKVSTDIDMLKVGPGFFETMHIPSLSGRTFTVVDFGTGKPAPVAVVNRAFVRRFVGDRNPLGLHFGGTDPNDVQYEIVGVVGDTKYEDLRTEIAPTAFIPIESKGGASFEVRTAGDPSALIPTVRRVIGDLDSEIPVFGITTQSQTIDHLLFAERLIARLSTLFGLLALLLACIGLYGLLSYEVARRTREIGIRMALGAQHKQVLRLVVRQGIVLALIGAVIGSALAIGVTRYLTSLLFGVRSTDPITFGAVTLLLLVVALAACWIPARRAMRVDPMVALRYE
jgi:predicted permease